MGSSISKTKIEDLTYAYRPAKYLSGAGRHDEATTYSVGLQSFDQGGTSKNTASGGNMTLKPSGETGSMGMSLKTDLLNGSNVIVASMELTGKDELAEDITIYGSSPFLPSHQPTANGLFVWAKVGWCRERGTLLVTMADTEVYVLDGNKLVSSYVLLHQGKKEQPVLVLGSNSSESAERLIFKIGPQADPHFMLCIVSCVERIRASRSLSHRIACCM